MVDKISGPYGTQISKLDAKRRKSNVSGSSFGSILDSFESAESPASEAAQQAAPASALNPLFAMQEVSVEDASRKSGLKRGKMTLDALDQLRMSLLMGNIPPHVVRNLQHVVDANREAVYDPKLTAILDEIELRAAVEYAKLEMAAQDAGRSV